MAADQAYIANLDPSFAAIPSERAAFFIDAAKAEVIPDVWGDRADYATALITLHIFTLSKTKGRGNVVEEELKDLRRRFSDTKGKGKDSLELTTWGQEYKRIARALRSGPMVTG